MSAGMYFNRLKYETRRLDLGLRWPCIMLRDCTGYVEADAHGKIIPVSIAQHEKYAVAILPDGERYLPVDVVKQCELIAQAIKENI